MKRQVKYSRKSRSSHWRRKREDSDYEPSSDEEIKKIKVVKETAGPDGGSIHQEADKGFEGDLWQQEKEQDSLSSSDLSDTFERCLDEAMQGSADDFCPGQEQDTMKVLDHDSDTAAGSGFITSKSNGIEGDDSEPEEYDRYSSEESFSSECFDSFEMHRLEEEPEDYVIPANAPLQDERFPEDNPDDPDDPHWNENNNDNNDSESEDDAEAPEAANFVHDGVNNAINVVNNCTRGEIILMEIANATRHKNTFSRIIDSFKNMNMYLGPNFLPESKTKLWSDIKLDATRVQQHIYCGRKKCGQYLGLKDRLGDVVRCDCNYTIAKSKAKWFVSLDLKSQIKYLLSIPGIWEHLQYPYTRQKASATAIEDIYDGSEYQRLKRPGGVLESRYNFSFTFNMDAINPTKRGSLKVVPVLLRINELPPNMRQKFHLLAAVYVDNTEPNYQAYLKPLVKQLNSLSTRGVQWKPDGVNEVNSKIIPLIECVDSPVRCAMYHMAKWDSVYGCTYCTHRGIRAGGSTRYPTVNLEGVPPFEERSHQGMLDRMREAQELQERNPERPVNHFGHKGASELMLLRHHDLREGQAVDDLHQDHEGVAQDLTDLLLTAVPRIPVNMANVDLLRAIDGRLLNIRTPSKISRKVRSIQKCGNWSGSEWRNWLFFFGVPCMVGLVEPRYLNVFACISHACYLLTQDVIEPADLETAENLMQRAATEFEELFGIEKIKFNFHVTTSHKVNSVRKLGPSYAYSTYNFESLNSKIAKMVTSPKGAVVQLVTRSILGLTVSAAQFDNRISESVRERLDEILNNEKLQRVTEFGPGMYLVGKGVTYNLSHAEQEIILREGFNNAEQVQEFKGCLIGSTRFRSYNANDNIKSDDSFIYSSQDTFCTIQRIVMFNYDNGQQCAGAFVVEHAVARIMPVIRHVSVLQNAGEDLQHFLPLENIRSPAIKMRSLGFEYAVAMPNCIEID